MLLFDSRVSEGGTEVLADVGLQNRIEMMELSVCDQSDYENLSEAEDAILHQHQPNQKHSNVLIK